MATLSLKKSKGTAAPPQPGPESAGDRIRRLAVEQLGRHDEAVRAADIRPGDPIEPVLTASRDLIEWTAEMAGNMAEATRALSPEAERLLVDRIASLTVIGLKAEKRHSGQSIASSLKALVGLCIFSVVFGAAIAGYQFGVRNGAVTFQLASGNIVGPCQRETIQSAPDGRGRVCAVWVRLDQATPLTEGNR